MHVQVIYHTRMYLIYQTIYNDNFYIAFLTVVYIYMYIGTKAICIGKLFVKVKLCKRNDMYINCFLYYFRGHLVMNALIVPCINVGMI